MKAVRLTRPGQPLELQDIPVPAPGPTDAVVRVKAAGICHSDAHYRAGKSRVEPLPLTLGHEVAGMVEAVGSGVTDFKEVIGSACITWPLAATVLIAKRGMSSFARRPK